MLILSKEIIKNWLLTHRKITKHNCWLYTGHKDLKGYGQLTINCKSYRINRLSLWIFKDLDLNNKNKLACHNDNLCNSTSCFNPEHLYVGTHQDNKQDSIKNGSDFQANKRFCKNGHEFTKENTFHSKWKRYCKICRKISKQKYLVNKRVDPNKPKDW